MTLRFADDVTQQQRERTARALSRVLPGRSAAERRALYERASNAMRCMEPAADVLRIIETMVEGGPPDPADALRERLRAALDAGFLRWRDPRAVQQQERAARAPAAARADRAGAGPACRCAELSDPDRFDPWSPSEVIGSTRPAEAPSKPDRAKTVPGTDPWGPQHVTARLEGGNAVLWRELQELLIAARVFDTRDADSELIAFMVRVCFGIGEQAAKQGGRDVSAEGFLRMLVDLANETCAQEPRPGEHHPPQGTGSSEANEGPDRPGGQ